MQARKCIGAWILTVIKHHPLLAIPTMNTYTQSPYIKRDTLGNHPSEKHMGGEDQNTSFDVKC